MLEIGLLSHEKKTMASIQPITKTSTCDQAILKINPPYSTSTPKPQEAGTDSCLRIYLDHHLAAFLQSLRESAWDWDLGF